MDNNGISFIFWVFSFQIYKIEEVELRVSTLLDAVVGRMASKEFVAF